jgi:hypothetical protein
MAKRQTQAASNVLSKKPARKALQNLRMDTPRLQEHALRIQKHPWPAKHSAPMQLMPLTRSPTTAPTPLVLQPVPSNTAPKPLMSYTV